MYNFAVFAKIDPKDRFATFTFWHVVAVIVILINHSAPLSLQTISVAIQLCVDSTYSTRFSGFN